MFVEDVEAHNPEKEQKGTWFSMLRRLERINHSVSAWLERIGIIGLLVMLGVTCVDVLGTKCFRSPIHGAIDIVMLCQVVAIAFTIAIAQIAGRHVRVELFVSKLSDTSQAVIDTFIYLFQFILFALIAWRTYVLARSLQIAGEVSATLFVPLHPFIFAIALGCIPVCIIFLLKFLNSVIKVARR
jgi:TRAP-type C4-dicarboxylate transport system permease small subunit